ncbi:MAG: TAT-variant-translocated molybdopterin oxidoreductase, partial [Crocinitomicaceae bacterium]|nr:TAT-variant-translocated molybdopterin oxidoreductase [Crocinitomicaceae bacterium]
MERKYWKGIDELNETPQFLESGDKEFPAQNSVEEFLGDESLQESSTGRRDFLKFLGFSVAAATVAACEAPVTKAIPYVNKPEDVIPGMPTWYASTYYDGMSYASILVKTREGRPIFIKGNKDYGITSGSINPQIAASVLGLYDSERLTRPTIKGDPKSYRDLEKGVKTGLKSANKVVVVSNTLISPSVRESIRLLGVSIGEDKFDHIEYDAVSYAGMRAANKASLKVVSKPMMDTEGNEMVDPDAEDKPGIIPSYDFSKAKTIVSVGADFLNSWLMPTMFAPQYGETRNPDAEWMSKHFQFESMLSITGSNADVRAMIKPSEQANVLSYILKGFGVDSGVSSSLKEGPKTAADKAIEALKHSKSESIIVCGSNETSVQILTNKLNHVLGAYNSTINVNNPINLFKSQDDKMSKFASDVANGNGPDGVIFYGVNPVYTLPNGKAFAKGLKKVKTSVSMSLYADETTVNCKYVASDLHSLESWTDHWPVKHHYGVGQPTIRPLHNTASALESFLVWAGEETRGGKDSQVAYKFIQGLWDQHGFQDPEQTKYSDFHTYWNMMVHNSCDNMMEVETSNPDFIEGSMSELKFAKVSGSTEIVMYQKAAMGVGAHANNPWLQEMPDPMTKATWDNYFTMNPTTMTKKGYATTFDQENGLNKATVKVNGTKITLPVFPLPGQAIGTVGVALGYGRGGNGEKIGKGAYQTKEYGGHIEGENGKPASIGANAFAFTSLSNGTYSTYASGTLTDAEGIHQIAATQIHSTVMGRHSVVRETTKSTYDKEGSKEAYNPTWTLQKLDEHGHHVDAPMSEFDLWDAHPVEKIGHRWGMTIDLSSCIGCGTCLIACQSENNVPVVGKDEIRRGREMHWLRIDRYYASDVEAAPGTRTDHGMSKMEFFKAAEEAAENPMVVHQPMMCHHCNHAPCETVCPVAATTHSNEGLNQMVYNRCIGTRY